MTELSISIFGGYTQNYWISAFFFGFLGFMLYKYLTYDTTTKVTSPDNFSMIYWIDTNWKDIFGGLLLFFLWVRFKNEVLDGFPQHPLSIWLKIFTDNVFIHLMFGVLHTHIVRLSRKSLKKLK